MGCCSATHAQNAHAPLLKGPPAPVAGGVKKPPPQQSPTPATPEAKGLPQERSRGDNPEAIGSQAQARGPQEEVALLNPSAGSPSPQGRQQEEVESSSEEESQRPPESSQPIAEPSAEAREAPPAEESESEEEEQAQAPISTLQQQAHVAPDKPRLTQLPPPQPELTLDAVDGVSTPIARANGDDDRPNKELQAQTKRQGAEDGQPVGEASKDASGNALAIPAGEQRQPKKVVVSRQRAGKQAGAIKDGQLALEDGQGKGEAAAAVLDGNNQIVAAAGQHAKGKVKRQNKSKEELQEIDVLSKHYEVGKKIGSGTFGVVHECHKHADKNADDTQQIYAVKYIDKVSQEKDVILLETNMLRELDHPNVVKCLDVFDEKDFMCIVMEKWDGRDVVSRLIEHTDRQEDLPEPSVAHLVKQMLSSLVYLHSHGVIHRDVKMDNYLIDKSRLDDNSSRLALSDFGCATYLKLGERLEESVGTKVYKSPEFIMENYCHKVDVWAVGVSMYGLLNGSLPFSDESAVLQSRPLMPQGLTRPCLTLLKRLMMKNEARRPLATEALEDPFLAEAGARTEAEGATPAEGERRSTSSSSPHHTPETEATACPPSDERLDGDLETPREESDRDEVENQLAVHEPNNPEKKVKKIAKKKKKDPDARAIKDGESVKKIKEKSAKRKEDNVVL